MMIKNTFIVIKLNPCIYEQFNILEDSTGAYIIKVCEVGGDGCSAIFKIVKNNFKTMIVRELSLPNRYDQTLELTSDTDGLFISYDKSINFDESYENNVTPIEESYIVNIL